MNSSLHYLLWGFSLKQLSLKTSQWIPLCWRNINQYSSTANVPCNVICDAIPKLTLKMTPSHPTNQVTLNKSYTRALSPPTLPLWVHNRQGVSSCPTAMRHLFPLVLTLLPWFQNPALQTSERINFSSFKPHYVHGNLTQQSWKPKVYVAYCGECWIFSYSFEDCWTFFRQVVTWDWFDLFQVCFQVLLQHIQEDFSLGLNKLHYQGVILLIILPDTPYIRRLFHLAGRTDNYFLSVG